MKKSNTTKNKQIEYFQNCVHTFCLLMPVQVIFHHHTLFNVWFKSPENQPRDIRPEMLCFAPLELPGPRYQLPRPKPQFFPTEGDGTGQDGMGRERDIFAEVGQIPEIFFGEPMSAPPHRDIAQQPVAMLHSLETQILDVCPKNAFGTTIWKGVFDWRDNKRSKYTGQLQARCPCCVCFGHQVQLYEARSIWCG